MRMWMVQPELMCGRHLSGEHGELHKHRHLFVKGHSIEGRKGQIEPEAMGWRHDELEAELVNRAVKEGRRPPSSPYEMPSLDLISPHHRAFKVDRVASMMALAARCPECRDRMALMKKLVRLESVSPGGGDKLGHAWVEDTFIQSHWGFVPKEPTQELLFLGVGSCQALFVKRFPRRCVLAVNEKAEGKGENVDS